MFGGFGLSNSCSPGPKVMAKVVKRKGVDHRLWKGEEPGVVVAGTEAEEGQPKNILQIQKNILNRNVFLKSLSKSLTNLKNYCKS